LAVAVVGLAAVAAAVVLIRAWRLDRERSAALAAAAAGRFTPARERLDAYLRRRPTDDEALFRLGQCERALGRPDQAVAAWSRVPDGSPRAPG
jgi:tetratricopeptide (TPR) repeat protein